jgi:diadenosine tetraphosphate (Ap4A) HIT family hydrolase
MTVPGFTEPDLARLALSARLRDLSEAFRLAVAAEDAGPELGGRLWELLAEEVPALREAIVAHVRAGGGWSEVAALTGVGEDEARERWDAEPPAPRDPAAEASALDDWYVRHAQFEQAADFRNPVSRLLSANAGPNRECWICVKYDGGAYPGYGGFTDPPGGYLHDDGMWRVSHGPTAYWPAGTLLIEAHRHYLDHAEMTDAEAAAIGPLIRRFTAPLKEATGAPRIHVYSCMEGCGHFHTWLVPRVGEIRTGRGFLADPGYCSRPEAVAAVARLRAALDRAGAAR